MRRAPFEVDATEEILRRSGVCSRYCTSQERLGISLSPMKWTSETLSRSGRLTAVETSFSLWSSSKTCKKTDRAESFIIYLFCCFKKLTQMWLKSDHHSYKTIAAAYPRANTAKSVPTSFAALSTRFANSLIKVPSVLGCLAFEI